MINTETYYISTGALTAMYTLRAQWYENAVIEGENVSIERDNYIRNLSTDGDTAALKANAMGYAVTAPLFDLNEIKRRRSDHIARLVKEREDADEIDRVAKEQRLVDLIKDGRFPFGKFGDKKFEAADRGYIMYWLKYNGFYGWVSIVKIILDTGEMVVYQGTGNLALPNGDSFAEGDVLIFDCTVKSHEVYDGEIQTKVQRLKFKGSK